MPWSHGRPSSASPISGVLRHAPLVHEGRVFGAYGFDLDDGVRRPILADAVVLAAGGHTRIWRRSSSRRDENTGDVMRLAAEAGRRLQDTQSSRSSTRPGWSGPRNRPAPSSPRRRAVREAAPRRTLLGERLHGAL